MTNDLIDEKPLFIPLKRKFYDAFEKGVKTVEFRAYGPRWNERTCRVGRPVIISCGYGKKQRMAGEVSCANLAPATAAFREIYGAEKQCFAISITGLRPI